MYEVFVESFEFALKFLKRDFAVFGDYVPLRVEGKYAVYGFDNYDDVCEFTYGVVFNSRLVRRVFLKIVDFESLDDDFNLDLSFIEKEFSFEVDSVKSCNWKKKDTEVFFGDLILKSNESLSVDLDNYDLSFVVDSVGDISYLLLDLVGFSLDKRGYKLNYNSNCVNSIIPNYCFYLLELDDMEGEDGGFSMIDCYANMGDFVIEASMFNPRVGLNVKNRLDVVCSKIFGYRVRMPRSIDNSKNKVVAVVDNNKIFKQLRENINFSSQKIKISQFEFDWLDVKFKEGEFDYVCVSVPSFADDNERYDFLADLLYQSSFIAGEAICLISKQEIDKKMFKKDKLKIDTFEKIVVGEQEYFVYVLVCLLLC